MNTYKLDHLEEVHIWKFTTDKYKSYINLFTSWLSNTEYKYMAQLKNKNRQQAFIISRGIIKQIISMYLGHSPATIEIFYTSYMKPYLKNQFLYFNISHSADLVLIALARKPVGIDIEKLRDIEDYDRTAALFLSDKEKRLLYNNETSFLKKNTFFEIWTHKEAVVKALGYGLHFPLHKINILHSKHQFLNTIYIKNKIYTVRDILIDKNYRTAICKEGKIHEIHIFQFENLSN